MMLHSTDQTIRDLPLTKISHMQNTCPCPIEDDLGLSTEKPQGQTDQKCQVKSESSSDGV